MPASASAITAVAPARPALASVANEPGGWIEARPRFRQRLEAIGLTSAAAFLDLPGVVVCGHPDRHVRRVELPGWERPLYLKRQHRVGWRERLRQRLTGFGWSARCRREAAILRELESLGFAAPSWVAHGEDGRGRAFLLVEELPGAELRAVLSDRRLSAEARCRLAERMGQAIAELHAAGFDTPDLAAKHVLVDVDSMAVALIDWQSARRHSHLGLTRRLRPLAALHASLVEHLASPQDRLRFLWAYRRVCRRAGLATPRTSVLAVAIERMAAKARLRRSIRDQRQPAVTAAGDLRLVWLADEAVCAIPEVAAVWPKPAIDAPFYGDAVARLRVGLTPITIPLPDGRPGTLLRGTSLAPVARLLARIRGRSWRSPGANFGRLLFHLQRCGIPAPRLLAFGQRLTGPATAEWFALHEPASGIPLAEWLEKTNSQECRREVLERVRSLLKDLHDAGCRYSPAPNLLHVEEDLSVSIGSVLAVRLERRISARQRRADLTRFLRTTRR
jgi:tRNA A-37 threonylcarbamoyl transferase component Bud32